MIELYPDDLFDTAFEKGCIVLEQPDAEGSFDAIDSDGVRAAYHVSMVVAVTGHLLPL